MKLGRDREAAKRRQESKALLRDVDGAIRNGTVRPELVPHVIDGRDVSRRLLAEHGAAIGDRGAVIDLADVTYAKALHISNIGRAQQAISVVTLRLVQTGDPEMATRLATLINAQRQNLALLGLERVEPKVVDLKTYLAERESGVPDESGESDDQ